MAIACVLIWACHAVGPLMLRHLSMPISPLSGINRDGLVDPKHVERYNEFGDWYYWLGLDFGLLSAHFPCCALLGAHIGALILAIRLAYPIHRL